MDSLFNILSNREFDEPPEIRVIKQYIREHFREAANVLVRERDVIITVRSSALAGTLRTRAQQLAKLIANEAKDKDSAPKRLVFRVGTPERR